MKIIIEDVFASDVASLLDTMSKLDASPNDAESKVLLHKLSPIFRAVLDGQKITAIKALRELTSCGLKEAKDVIEGNY